MPRSVTEYHDIQAILRSGFGALKEASFVLLRVTDKSEVKAWLAAVAGMPGAEKLTYEVTHAKHVSESYQERVLQIAFTAPGLLNLGVPKEFFPEDSITGPASERVHTFSREFYLGMAGDEAEELGRSRRLGDIGKNAPCEWEWGRPPDKLAKSVFHGWERRQPPEDFPDVLLLLYAESGDL